MTTLARTGEPLDGAAFDAPCYRIPALAVTPAGRVIAAWDVRADWRDLPGPFDIVYRISDDNGGTWSDVRVLRRRTDAGGFGDASFVVRADGTLFCWYVGSTGRSFFTADAGPEGEGLTLWRATSIDDGDTWTHRDLTADLKPADVTGMFASSGHGATLSSGRLLQPMVLRTEAGEHYAATAYSDDSGATWQLGERVGPDCDENKVLGLADGRVLLHARARPRRRWALSDDGGVSFSEPVPHGDLVDPACNGGLARWGSDVVCTLLDDPRERRRLALRVSSDDGATWGHPILLDDGAAAYSVAGELPDGRLGVIWEAGDYTSIEFLSLSRAELGLEGGEATFEPRQSAGGSAAPPETGA
ncbi:sialidase family protein [Tessaracoccus massiliensis]|uniref:sialidase family protein n=1 Tax=Tessaracoccus massiliensis TaxID=1522311 RepID=UPI0006931EF7|nr:sialidase family protein [Tessaracoccus massiliensis]